MSKKEYLEGTNSDALKHVQETINSAEDFHVTWSFDEQQADPFHTFWDGRVFKKHLQTILDELKESRKEN